MRTIDKHFQYAPNVDVVIFKNSGQYKVCAIECKFTEAYSTHGHGGLDPKYLAHEEIWQNLPATQNLAQTISPADQHFERLHAAQLVKHILGLNRKFGHAHYRLLYLWYDALGEPGAKHRPKVEEFTDVVHADGVVFHTITYQELMVRLAQHRAEYPGYVTYMTERYL